MDHKRCRMTNQRKVILEELRKFGGHPTVDELYVRVREKLPDISISTVYRNLEVLSECGLIGKLEPERTQKQFDANPKIHFHIRCTNCGRLDDIPSSIMNEVEEAIQKAQTLVNKMTGYDMKGYHLEFLGLCPKCKESMKKRGRSTDERKGENGGQKD